MMLSSANLPRFYNYEQALKHYESVVPYRSGHAKGQRPLGNRKYQSCMIRKTETDAIALDLYQSGVVYIKPNDEFHISLCRYDTVSTRQFIYATTPFNIKHERGVTYLGVRDGWYQFKDSDTTLIVHEHKVLNPAPQKTYKVNRSALKDLHKKYGGFREYVKCMGTVMAGIDDKEVVAYAQRRGAKMQRLILPASSHWWPQEARNPESEGITFLEEVEEAQVSNNLEKFYDLYLKLGVSSLFFNGYLKSWIPTSNDGKQIATPMLKFFDELLKSFYKESVFIEIDVPLGQACSNINRKYFK